MDMEVCWAYIEFLFSYHADKSTDYVWLDTLYFHPNTSFAHTKLNISCKSMQNSLNH